ncbi:MAG: trigger factor [Anaerolineae bacterium]|nr:trigger factor [Anaerolineae bacterium]
MNITTESLESRQMRLTIELDEKETQQAMQRAARNISKQVNIPGFRKGKAPYDLVLQRFGEDTVRKEAAEALVEEAYDKALKQEGIEPYAPAALEKADLDPITFTFSVPLRPVVELGDYRDYRLKYKQAKVSKSQVEEALQDIRMQNAILELVERPVEMGDGASVSFSATVGGEVVLKEDTAHVMVEADASYPAPGFAQELVGMSAGDKRTFTLTLPDDFPRGELRGQEAEFSAKMMEVYDQTIPDLDDDLARTVGGFDSLKNLEKQIKEELRRGAQQGIDQEYVEQVLSDLVERARIEYPPVSLERELDEAVEEFRRIVRRDAKLSLEDYLRFQNKTMEGFREELVPSAEARLKRALLLGQVAQLEELDVDKEEIRAQIEAMSAPWGVRAEEVRSSFNSDAGQRAVRSRLLANKVLQRLVAIAKGEMEAGAGEEEETLEGQESEEIGEEE